MGYDFSPGITTENKKDFYKFIQGKGLKLIYEHDPKFWGSNDKGDVHYEAKNELSYSIDIS